MTEDRLLKTVDQPLPVAIIADNLWALTRKYDFFNTAGDIDKPDLQLAKIVVGRQDMQWNANTFVVVRGCRQA